jgi:hypothetical protein
MVLLTHVENPRKFCANVRLTGSEWETVELVKLSQVAMV